MLIWRRIASDGCGAEVKWVGDVGYLLYALGAFIESARKLKDLARLMTECVCLCLTSSANSRPEACCKSWLVWLVYAVIGHVTRLGGDLSGIRAPGLRIYF